MTSISFYKISGGWDAALHFACQLTEKAFRQQMTVLIHTRDQEQAEKLDQLLWSFSATAFLPHSPPLPNQSTDHRHTIAISHQDQPDHCGFLINLSDTIPDWFSRFERAAEIIYDNHAVIEQKRKHYCFFKDRGYPIQYYDIDSATPAERQ